jgi:hypothetical protein
MTYYIRTGRGGRERSGGGALCVGIGKKSKLSFIHRQLGHPLSDGGLGKSDRSDLNLSPNSLDSRFKVIEPQGQTMQKKQAELLEQTRRAMALRTHL